MGGQHELLSLVVKIVAEVTFKFQQQYLCYRISELARIFSHSLYYCCIQSDSLIVKTMIPLQILANHCQHLKAVSLGGKMLYTSISAKLK